MRREKGETPERFRLRADAVIGRRRVLELAVKASARYLAASRALDVLVRDGNVEALTDPSLLRVDAHAIHLLATEVAATESALRATKSRRKR